MPRLAHLTSRLQSSTTQAAGGQELAAAEVKTSANLGVFACVFHKRNWWFDVFLLKCHHNWLVQVLSFKKSRLPNKNWLAFCFALMPTCVSFWLRRGMNHPMNPVTYHLLISSNVDGYSPRWSAIELGGDIPNQLGSLELANLPGSLHDSPDTTGKQMIRPMETSLYCFCFKLQLKCHHFCSDTCWS